MYCASFITLALALVASAAPMTRRAVDAATLLKNGQDAIALNEKFKTLTKDSPCTTGEEACVDGKFAQCVGSKFVTQSCAATTICAALPLVNKQGTSISCDFPDDVQQRIAATGAKDDGSATAPPPPPPPPSNNAGNNDGGNNNSTNTDNGGNNNSTNTDDGGNNNNTNTDDGGNNNNTNTDNGGDNNNNNNGGGDPQTSLTLDPNVIAKGFANDGQDVPTAGQVASLTSTNNFINFCLTVNLPLTNGQQITGGSCNPAPMGTIPSTDNMPSSKFTFPKNGQTIPADQPFTISMAIKNLETGNFVNANENYFSAPQQLNAQGTIKGHSHVVIEQLSALDAIEPLDPKVFAFFKGLNGAAQDGLLTASVDKGLPAGFYKLSSINTAANHQPVLVPVAQHGSLDDAVYFTVQ